MISALLLVLFASSAFAASCSTWYETTTHSSTAFRNVKDYGAKGDGVTDDTAAFNAALTTGRSPKFTTDTPLVVYVPSGTYIVSQTLEMYMYTHFVGNFECRPTIKLADNTAPAGHGMYVLSATMDPTGEHVSNFYHQVRHIVLDLGSGNEGATGIHWAVAQATAIRDVQILAGSSVTGIFIENGGGGYLGNIEVIGGQNGIQMGGQQWTLESVSVRDSQNACIDVIWNWVFTVINANISNCPKGIDFTSTAVTSLVVMDSSFANVNISVDTAYPVSPLRGLLLDRVTTSHSNYVTNAVKANPSGTVTLRSWRQGNAFEGQTPDAGSIGNLTPVRADAPLPIQARPTFGPTVYNVMDAGAKGDGQTDDTAAIRKAIATADTVFFPHGQYLISDTITLGPSTSIVGEVLSELVGKANSPAFMDPNNPTPMIVAPQGSTVHLADLLLTVQADLPGCLLLQWQASADSTLHDVHYRMYFGAWGLAHVPPGGAGVWSNAWLWVADHNINSGEVITVKNPRGFLYESDGPMLLVGTAVEHSYLYQYNISQGSNLVMTLSQTESEYFEKSSAWALQITDSSNILSYGSGYYTWFYGGQESLTSVTNSKNVSLFAANVEGSHNILAGDFVIPNTTCSNATFTAFFIADQIN